MKKSVAVVVVVALLVAKDAEAQRVRRRFEPTDLRLTPTGVAEIDLQAGYLRSDQGHSRVFAPDVEASIGVSERVELEVDTTYGFHDGEADFLDDTWASLRLGIVDDRREGESQADAAWAAGAQAGPRIPTTSLSKSIGFEGIFIAGRNVGPAHVFGQIGGLVDPFDLAFAPRRVRPVAIEGGLDLDLDLDQVDAWSLHAELGGARYFSPHPDQIHASAGPSYRVVPWLEVSVVGVAGLLPGADRWGVLFGMAPRFRAF